MHRSEPAAVRVRGVGHRYGRRQALSGLDLEIPVGGAVAVVGPDGVGKSTLLSLIAGTRRLQDGSVEVFGGTMRSHAHRHRVAQRIAFMPQGLGRNLYPTLSVRENLDFFGRLYGQGASERRSRVRRLLRATGLEPFPDRPAGKLSGGMRQKLALCAALIHDPDLLILDEPTTGVDPLSRRQFWRLIEEIQAERPAMTLIVATAYMEEAERFPHLVALGEGRLLGAGPLEEILAAGGTSRLEDAYRILQGGTAAGAAKGLAIPPRRNYEGPPVIEAERLTRRFGDFVAVDAVSFRIERGEIFGFLGSNGCGKTTTMKMLTGLLPASAGSARLLGQPVDGQSLETRLRVGYVSQSFSLYEELSVRGNLALHARLYRVPEGEVPARVAAALARFELEAMAEALPGSLPLGQRQRLQLAAACLHRPEVLILDEPTSGVDPAARDRFWRILGELSRDEGVTIFISTHFMNEAERCDRISLMHRGQVLAIDRPEALVEAKDAAGLEQAFIAYLEQAGEGEDARPKAEGAASDDPTEASGVAGTSRPDGLAVSLGRIWAFARREGLELLRDRVRLAFALLGPLLLLFAFGYGISFDVENLTWAAFDRDQSVESRQLLESFDGSRYFERRPAVADEFEIDRRLRSGELRAVVGIPPGFGRDLLEGRRPEVSVWLDGAMPFRAETARGYVQGVLSTALEEQSRQLAGSGASGAMLSVEPRFRYNQDFRSLPALVPGTIMLLLILIPAMLTAVGVVREKEVGSIMNLYSAPASVGEFLLGKQLPYAALSLASFALLLAATAFLLGVTVTGSLAALILGALLYVYAATAFGLLVSTLVGSQVAAIFASAILTVIPAVNFSGLLYPTASVEGAGRWIGLLFPASWFKTISSGVFSKGLGLEAFGREYLMLAGFTLVFLLAARVLLSKQER